MHRDPAAWVAAMAVLVGCQPATSRPPFPPAPQAAMSEVRLPVGEATRLLAEAFKADSMPVQRVEVKDAWLETSWFDAATGRHIGGRPLGANTVRVRAWADATHPGSSKVTVETIYRPLADPSLSDRELDRQVPRDHPIAIKVRAALQDLVKRYGGPPPPAAAPGAGPENGEPSEVTPADEAPPDETPDEGAPEESAPDKGAPEAASP
jgi:hypothetical protein